MKILLDTNVILDVLLDREPHATVAAHLLSAIEEGQIVGYIGSTTVTTIHYLVSKAKGRAHAKEAVRGLLDLCEIAPVNRAVLEKALDFKLSDYEDAVLCAAATHVGVDALITRNLRDFREVPLTIYSPEELRQLLKESSV